jgi:hypothetical protein
VCQSHVRTTTKARHCEKKRLLLFRNNLCGSKFRTYECTFKQYEMRLPRRTFVLLAMTKPCLSWTLLVIVVLTVIPHPSLRGRMVFVLPWQSLGLSCHYSSCNFLEHITCSNLTPPIRNSFIDITFLLLYT